MNKSRILIVEFDSNTRLALARFLDRNGMQIVTANNLADAQNMLKRSPNLDFILAPIEISDVLMESAKSLHPQMKMFVSAPADQWIDEEKGYAGVLTKPILSEDVLRSIKRSLALASPVQKIEITEVKKTIHTGIIGTSPEIKELLELTQKVALTDATVLITGESGTGKELIARMIHQNSNRKSNGFVPINCGAIPSELMESELFGHLKGAFTGAVANRSGKFEIADQGTLFLDEIGDLPPSLQVKLLRVLQERVIEPVGSTKSFPINVRVIAATHRNLEELVSQGKFREDLYYRLNVIPLALPALKDRKSDIPELVLHFLKKFDPQGRVSFSADTLANLLEYPWPGNIRELENLVERLCVFYPNSMVTAAQLPKRYIQSKVETFSFSENVETNLDFNSAVDQFENNLILKALEKTGWNRNQAAAILKLNRTTLLEKMKKKGLKPPFPEANSEV